MRVPTRLARMRSWIQFATSAAMAAFFTLLIVHDDVDRAPQWLIQPAFWIMFIGSLTLLGFSFVDWRQRRESIK
jgi:hypothetical protein